MKGIKRFLLLFTVVLLLVSCGVDNSFIKPEKIFDGVFDLGEITRVDFNGAMEHVAEFADNWACTAAVKQLSDGDWIIGRNLDLTVCQYPIFSGVVNAQGLNKVRFLATSLAGIEKENEVEKFGISEATYSLIPFLATDVLNEHGLYIETNMRSDNCNRPELPVLGCSYTNLNATTRICAASLPMYLALHCSNVSEAINMLNSLDVYTLKMGKYQWSFAFMLCDSEGNHGLLEFACNSWKFIPDQDCQTNFYIDKEYASKSEYHAGYGRYNYVMDNLKNVESEEDMLSLLKPLWYSHSYDFISQWNGIDWRTEIVGDFAKFTTDYVLDFYSKLSGKLLQDLSSILFKITPTFISKRLGLFWISRYSLVANVNDLSMTVIFNENPVCKKTFTLKNY